MNNPGSKDLLCPDVSQQAVLMDFSKLKSDRGLCRLRIWPGRVVP
jgi:hypothetical protein